MSATENVSRWGLFPRSGVEASTIKSACAWRPAAAVRRAHPLRVSWGRARLDSAGYKSQARSNCACDLVQVETLPLTYTSGQRFYGIIRTIGRYPYTGDWRGSVVWPNAHAWRACLEKSNAGSNPALSADKWLTPGGRTPSHLRFWVVLVSFPPGRARWGASGAFAALVAPEIRSTRGRIPQRRARGFESASAKWC